MDMGQWFEKESEGGCEAVVQSTPVDYSAGSPGHCISDSISQTQVTFGTLHFSQKLRSALPEPRHSHSRAIARPPLRSAGRPAGSPAAGGQGPGTHAPASA
jgi:hypothetical protein